MRPPESQELILGERALTNEVALNTTRIAV
jgi:hypothetical protein